MKIQGFWNTHQKTFGSYTRLLGQSQEEFCDIHQTISKKYPQKTSGTTLEEFWGLHQKTYGTHSTILLEHTGRILGCTPEEFWDIKWRNSGTYS